MNKFFTITSACVLSLTAFGEPARIAPPTGDEPIVYEQPDGQEAVFSRSCCAYREMLGDIEKIVEEGSLVTMVEQPDGTVWLHNLTSMYAAPGWVKASKAEGKISITGPQAVYAELDWENDGESMITYYLSPVEIVEYEDEDGETMRSYKVAEDGTFSFDILESGTLKESGDGSLVLGIVAYDEKNGYFWTGYGDNYITLTPPPTDFVTVPDGVEVKEDWAMIYYNSDGLENAQFIDVAIDGDDYYIKGLYPGLPEAWAKGTLDGDQLIIPNFQYLGADMDWGYCIYVAGGNVFGTPDDEYSMTATIEPDGFVLSLDADGQLSADNVLIFVTSPLTNPENANYVNYFEFVTIKAQDPSTFTVPANPYNIFLGGVGETPAIECTIPAFDDNDNILNIENLYFSAYVNSEIYTFDPDIYTDLYNWNIWEPTTEIPYNTGSYGYDFYQEGAWHTIYIYGVAKADIFNIGVQSIYYPEGKDVNPDNVLMSDIIMVGEASGVADIAAAKEVKEVKFFDLQGRSIDTPANGLYIKTTVYSDGTTKTVKVSRKSE